MKRTKGILAVLLLLVILIFSISAVWSEGLRVEEESGSNSGTKEEMIKRKLENWVPKMP